MSIFLPPEPVPLEVCDDGVVRVTGTQVTLDRIVAAFHQGVTPQEIVLEYPSVQLADVYATIAFYLRHRGYVEFYLHEQQQQVGELPTLDEAKCET